MLVECFNTNIIEFDADNYIYEKIKIQMNTNGIETIFARCVKKGKESFKGRIIIVKNGL